MSNANDSSGVGSGNPVLDIVMAANVLNRIAHLQTDNLENQVDATASLVPAAANMLSAIKLLMKVIKRNLVWSVVLTALLGLTLGNLVAAINLANKLGEVCGR